MNYCGKIEFDKHVLNVYNTLNEPMFEAVEVARFLDYSVGNTVHMLELVEQDEKILINRKRVDQTKIKGGNRKPIWFLTELGLYNVLSQSRKPIARGWRKVVHQELINLRKSREKSVIEQFEDWDDEMDTIFFDEETGVLMRSITLPGGDIDMVPVKED